MNDATFGVYNAPLSDMGATEALIAWARRSASFAPRAGYAK